MTTRVLLVGVAVAAMALTGCVSTVSGTAVRNPSTVPSNVPKLDESALERVLLPVDEINDIMGTTDLEITGDIDDMTDSSDKVSDPDCLAAMFGAENTEDTSSLWEFEEVAEGDGLITQIATQEDADGWGCQHALAVASNLTAETWVCAYNLGDEAAAMAIDILNNAASK